MCLAEYAACEIVMGVIGGVAAVLSVVLIVAYRSYRYEQELDSLLWKIDPIDLKVIHSNFTRVICTLKLYAVENNEVFVEICRIIYFRFMTITMESRL